MISALIFYFVGFIIAAYFYVYTTVRDEKCFTIGDAGVTFMIGVCSWVAVIIYFFCLFGDRRLYEKKD